MIHRLATILSTAAGVFAACSVGYYALCLWSAARFLRERKALGRAVAVEAEVGPTRTAPPVSILKPLKGTDPEMYESLRSHCLQDYGEYEIIFGVSDPGDPAVDLVERLQQEFPSRTIRWCSARKTWAPTLK